MFTADLVVTAKSWQLPSGRQEANVSTAQPGRATGSLHSKKEHCGAGEMTQQLKALAALTERTHDQFPTLSWQPTVTPVPGDPTPSSGFCRHKAHT